MTFDKSGLMDLIYCELLPVNCYLSTDLPCDISRERSNRSFGLKLETYPGFTS